ncbi:MAG: hypothetical protein V3S55_13880 [Nitrospiraceae bacterium]
MFLGRLAILLALLCTIPAMAVDHAVRAAATGADDGTNWDDAFTALPANLTRGDTYFIADGSYSRYTFDDAGTTRVTVIAATIASHGPAGGWLNSYAGTATFATVPADTTAFLIQADNITLSGAQRTTKTSGHGIFLDCSASTGPFCWAVQIDSGVDGVIIAFVEIEGTGDAGIATTPTEGVRCIGCTDLTVQSSYIHDCQDCMQTGGATTILYERNTCFNNGTDVVFHGQAWADEDSDSVVIRYSDFVDIEGTGGIIVLSREAGSQTAEGWDIYGITFRCISGSGNGCEFPNGTIACINGETCTNWRMFNISVFNVPSGNAGFRCLNGCLGSNRVADNNLWFDVTGAGGIVLDLALTHDWNTGLNITAGCGWATGGNETCTTTGSSDPYVDAANGDFHLVAATVAGDTKASPFNIDPDGNTRGADGTWDRGTFEFLAGAGKPSLQLGRGTTVRP